VIELMYQGFSVFGSELQKSPHSGKMIFSTKPRNQKR